MGEEPMMEMRPVERIAIPAGQSVALEPGGFHIMLLDLAEPLELGQQVDLTLVFENAGEVAVTAEIRAAQP
jgi:copper(I)-binding protein